MKKTSILLSFILAISILVSMILSVGASNTDEYFLFAQNTSRISSNGDFTVQFRSSVTSQKFVATSDTIKITITAQVYDSATDSYYVDNSVGYFIDIVKSGLFGGTVETLYCGCTGFTSTDTISVKNGATYFLRFRILTDVSGDGRYVYGEGNIKNIKLS